MKRKYITPSFLNVQVEMSACLCQSYGSIPVGGKTDSFEDSYIGTIPTGGGLTNELDAARIRDWAEYEKY